MMLPGGPKQSLTDVPGVRVGHFTVTKTDGPRPVRTGLTAIFTCPPEGNAARPAAIVTLGGRTEITGVNFIDDFGFLTNPIVATNVRSLGRVYDAMLSRRTKVALSWPPVVVGFDDGRLSDQRRAVFTEDEVSAALDGARDDKVPEGATGAAAGLVAFGYKSGVGLASRVIAADGASHVVGALALLNLGRREALRLGGTAAGRDAAATGGPPPFRGTGLIVMATDAPLDDRQCRRVAQSGLYGMARLGVVPGVREGLIACAVSTGVALARNDRRATHIDVARATETIVAAVSEAAADAAEAASLRT